MVTRQRYHGTGGRSIAQKYQISLDKEMRKGDTKDTNMFDDWILGTAIVVLVALCVWGTWDAWRQTGIWEQREKRKAEEKWR